MAARRARKTKTAKKRKAKRAATVRRSAGKSRAKRSKAKSKSTAKSKAKRGRSTRRSASRKSAKASSRKARAKARSKAKAPRNEVIGEGNYTASREFREDQTSFVKRNRARIPEMGKEAEQALEGPGGDELRRAEEEARSHAQGEA